MLEQRDIGLIDGGCEGDVFSVRGWKYGTNPAGVLQQQVRVTVGIHLKQTAPRGGREHGNEKSISIFGPSGFLKALLRRDGMDDARPSAFELEHADAVTGILHN